MSGRPEELDQHEASEHSVESRDVTELDKQSAGHGEEFLQKESEVGETSLSKPTLSQVQVRQELYLASHIRISDLNRLGVAQGRTDIKEPEQQHMPDLVNMEEYEDWMDGATTRGRKLDRQRKTFVGENIELKDIQRQVTTSDGELKKCRHAMILGAAGMGKSTLLYRIADQARRGKLESLKGKLIMLPDFRIFSRDEIIDPCKALLGSMCPDSNDDELTPRYQWILENSADVAFIVDSLDTMPFDLERERPPIGHFEKATVDVIVHNLLAGDLFPKSTVISSSREYKVRNLHPSVRPDRCILLDGLREKSVRELIDGFLGEEKGAEVKKHIDRECPDVWSLLSIPSLLVFGVIGFVQGGFSPKTMSGILIKFLLTLIQSKHAHVGDIIAVLRKLMPMSFHGIRNGRVLFTPEELMRFDLTPDEVKDLSIIVPQSGGGSYFKSKLIQNDRFFLYFNHQTLQECIAALHVLSMSTKEFEEFVESEIHEPKFGVVRRLVCGILLNDEVLNAAMKLGKISNVKEKRTVLVKNYSAALKHEQAREWDEKSRERLLELLIDVNEGKNGAIELIRSSVTRISLRRVPLRPSDVQAVASVMKQCDHLKDVNLRICKLDGKKMEILTSTVLQSKLKIDKLDISENNLGEEGALQVAKLCEHCEVKSLRARECMDSGNLKALVDGASCMKLGKLDVGENRSMGPGGVLHLGKLINNSKVEDLDMRMCDLRSEHMQQFAEGIGDAKLKKLNVNSNEELGPDGIFTLGKLVGNSEIEDLEAEVCNIESEHAEKLTEGLGHAKLRRLNVSWNQKIGKEGLFHLGRLVKNCRLEELDARMCTIDPEGLKKFSEAAEDAKLKKLDVSNNRDLGPEGMKLLGKIVNRFETKELIVTGCCPTKGVQKFKEGLGDSTLDSLNLANIWQPLYTRSILELLPHVKRELNLQHWFINGNQQEHIQKRLNEIANLNLTIKLGSSKNPTVLSAISSSKLEENLSSEENIETTILPTRFAATEGTISRTDGGILSLDGCSITFPPGCVKQNHELQMSVESGAPSDAPENAIALSPTLGCDLSAVDLVPGFELEVSIKLYCFSSGQLVPIVLLCKQSDSDTWHKERELMLGRNRILKFKTRTFSRRYYAFMRGIGLGWLITFPVIPHLYFDKFGLFKSYLCVDDQTTVDELESKHDSTGFKSALIMPEHLLAKLGDRITAKLDCIHPPTSNFGDDNQFDFLSDQLIDKAYVQRDFPLVNVPTQTEGGYIEIRFTLEKGVPAEETQKMSRRIEWPFVSDEGQVKNRKESPAAQRNIHYNIGVVNAENFVGYSEQKKQN